LWIAKQSDKSVIYNHFSHIVSFLSFLGVIWAVVVWCVGEALCGVRAPGDAEPCAKARGVLNSPTLSDRLQHVRHDPYLP